MKLSINWLGDFVDVSGVAPRRLAETLTLSTAEIEEVLEIGHGLGDFVTARIVGRTAHPSADNLSVVQVDAGRFQGEVVCGAPNVRVGAVGILAPAGTRLPDGAAVERTKIRGVASEGMLCSAHELRVGEDHSGILLLSDDLPVGCPVTEIPGFQDVVLEIDNKAITHRPDLWGHYGFAREVAAVLKRDLKPLFVASDVNPMRTGVPVTIEDPSRCSRYLALTIRGARIAPSPFWLRWRLECTGVRSISNFVDLTNYIMLEIGQPLHAFDLARLAGPEIRVRTAVEGETLTTLDGVVRKLDQEDLVIADGRCGVALAGVMGGADSEINDTTADVLLEAAHFDPVSVRRTSTRLGLRTEAVARFEKSLDPELPMLGVRRFVDLLPRAGVDVTSADELSESYVRKPDPLSISLNLDHVTAKLGVELPKDEVRDILTRLEFDVADAGPAGEPVFQVGVPTFRATKDIGNEEDLIEEVGRVFGYGNIPPEAPEFKCTVAPRDHVRQTERNVRMFLSGPLRMTEVSMYSFADDDHLEKLGLDRLPYVRLVSPPAQNMSRLRRDLGPALLALIEPNLRHTPSFSLYEIGRTYWPEKRFMETLPWERRHVAGAVVPPRREKKTSRSAPGAFDRAKGIVFDLLAGLRRGTPVVGSVMEELRSGRPWIHPSRACAVMLDGKALGYVSDVHPRVARTFEIDDVDVALFDLDLDLLAEMKAREVRFVPIPRFPSVKRDVSVLVECKRTVREIENVIRQVKTDWVESFSLIDVFTGAPIPEGKKSLTLRIVYRSPDRSLRGEEVDEVHGQVVDSLAEIGGTVRT